MLKLLTTLIIIVAMVPALARAFDHTHGQWDSMFKQYVVEDGPASSVKYHTLKKDSRQLQQYLQSLSAVRYEEFKHWNRDQQLAFLINAYNAFTLKLIVDRYPVDSIKDIGSFFRSSWKIEFFTLFGKDAHLDYIEHELIRGAEGFSQPRIHFAVVCASVGCPKLQPQAYTEFNLKELLEKAAKDFLTDRSRNRYEAQENTLALSSIFKWYGDDFEITHQSVKHFVAPYMAANAEQRALIESDATDIEYLDYDWSLNDAK